MGDRRPRRRRRRAGPSPPAGTAASGSSRALARVLVPAAAALAAQAAGRHHPRAQRRRSPPRLAEAELVEGERDLVADVDPDEVLQLERPHPEARRARDRVDRLDVGHALLQELQRLEAEGPVAAVDQEAGPVRRVDDLACPSPGRWPARRRAPRREESMPAMTSSRRITGGGLKKCMPTTRAGSAAAPRDRGDRDRRGVRGQHGAGRDRAQRGEQLALELEALGRRLDDQAAVGQPAELLDRRDRARARARGGPSARQRSRPSAIWARPRSRASSTGSWSSVRAPAAAASCAIPAPMVPAPTTPIVSGTALTRRELSPSRPRARRARRRCPRAPRCGAGRCRRGRRPRGRRPRRTGRRRRSSGRGRRC